MVSEEKDNLALWLRKTETMSIQLRTSRRDHERRKKIHKHQSIQRLKMMKNLIQSFANS